MLMYAQMLVSSLRFCMPSKLLSLLQLSGLNTVSSSHIPILLVILPPFDGYVGYSILCRLLSDGYVL